MFCQCPLLSIVSDPSGTMSRETSAIWFSTNEQKKKGIIPSSQPESVQLHPESITNRTFLGTDDHLRKLHPNQQKCGFPMSSTSCCMFRPFCSPKVGEKSWQWSYLSIICFSWMFSFHRFRLGVDLVHQPTAIFFSSTLKSSASGFAVYLKVATGIQHQWGYPFVAGWFSSGKIPSFEMDDDIKGYRGTPIWQEKYG